MVSDIADFYDGRCVFITGSTGFVGKVLVQKLLKDCPKIKTIFLLVRPKKGKTAKERLKDIFATKLFDELRKQQPDFCRKIVAVEGDILQPQFGLKANDLETLQTNVSVIYHSAATVRFDEPLRLSLQMNVWAVLELLHLAKTFTKLEALIHVSTAYANCDKSYVLEEVYPSPIPPNKLLDAAEWMSDGMMNALTPSLIRPRPNTYTYTKALAEYLLVAQCGDLPCAIVRPSIVGATLSDPFPGWVDNFNGPTGLLAAIGKGMLRVMKGNFDGVADIIPVDLCANLLIAVGYAVATDKSTRVKVFHGTSGELNRLTWGEVERGACYYFHKHPVENLLRLPNPRFTKSRVWHGINLWFDQQLPCWVMDLWLIFMGKQPVFQKIQTRLQKNIFSLDYFTSHQWMFSTEKVVALYRSLSEEDKRLFNFDVQSIDWAQYLENYCLGTKQHVLKEDLSKVENAKVKLQQLQVRDRLYSVFLAILLWQMVVIKFEAPKNFWSQALNWFLKLRQRMFVWQAVGSM